jgi:hypothetical protein
VELSAVTLSTILLIGGIWILVAGVLGSVVGKYLKGLVDKYYPEVEEE